jgi:Fe-Mn family superoxide dismutase
MTLHHDKHYAGYVSKYNAAVNASTTATLINATTPLPIALSLVGSLSSPDLDAALDAAVRNQGGGAWNHALFWKTLAPQGSLPTRYNSAASSQLKAAVDEYGGFALLTAELAKQAGGVFGSGWAWLCAAVSPYGAASSKRPTVGAPLAPPRLSVITSPNQDSPLTGMAAPEKSSTERCIPLLGVDVWEHAYYLKHRNLRADYVTALLGNGTTGTGGMINWAVVSSNYARVVKAAEKGTDAALLEAAGAIGQA